MTPALFDLVRIAVPYVARDVVSGRIRYESADQADCELWCATHPRVRWLVIERRDECHALDVADQRGLLRNVPGRKARRPVSQQMSF